uniref:Integrase, catalytic region, zinc finger, CCHC-type, peptidase aspartic, catalytic n=1 Tax=Tanacetum cinerariifolium TaxID=118510 RepID=A0A6L2ML46_TANCI|nr:hypothetical protein [Tanacetum cinerariifolium]
MMLDRFSQHTVDPLTLMSNVSHQQHYSPSSSTSPSIYVPPHLADNVYLDSSLSLTNNLIKNLTNTLALLTQSYKTFLPQTNNQLKTSSNTRNQATVQDGRVVVQNVHGRQNRGQGMNLQGGGAVAYGGVQSRVRNANPSQATQVKCYNCNGTWHIARNYTQPKCPQNSEYYKDKMLLMQAQENGVALDAEQLLFLAGGQDNAIDDDVDEQPAPMAQTMFIANLSSTDPVTNEAGPSYDLDILSEVAIGYKNPLCLTRAKQVQHALYNGHEIIKDNHVPAIVHNTKDTLEITEITRRKMNDKMKNPEYVTHKTTVSRPIKTLMVKHDAIERKNLFIVNDNLIAECLAKEVFFVATNSELNVSRFTEMHVANTIIEARCMELEVELSNLRNKSHNDNPGELVNRFSNLEVDYVNLRLKYQNLKDSFDNNLPTPDKDTLNFDSVFVIGKMQASLQGKDNVIRQLKKQISHLQETYSDTDVPLNKDQVKPKVLAPGKYAIDVKPFVPCLRNNREAYLDYLRHLKESVKTIHDIVEEAKVVRPLDRSLVSAFCYTKHSQELLEYVIGTCPQDSQQRDKKLAPASLSRKNQVTFAKQCDKSNSNTHKHVAQLHTQKTNVPVPPSTGVKRCTTTSGSQPKRNIKKNKISPAKGVNKLPVEE